ncbi:hypothetical protein FCV25MIE_06154 [Fagus crenata]
MLVPTDKHSHTAPHDVEELLVNGDLEVEEGLFVEQLLANKDFEEVEEWQLVAPNSFFDSFHFSSM